MTKREPIVVEIIEHDCPCDAEAAQRALVLLTVWAKRRAQRAAKDPEDEASSGLTGEEQPSYKARKPEN